MKQYSPDPEDGFFFEVYFTTLSVSRNGVMISEK
jgi:hypothetical protein